MKVLLTGAFGNVGLSTLDELLLKKFDVRILDIKNPKNEKIAQDYHDRVEIVWGDLRNHADVERAISGVDIVIHVGAIIPPLADEKPEFAYQVNVGGTKNIIHAIEAQEKSPKLIYTSSISVYGDRRKNPHIKVSDPLIPSAHDEYAKQKLECERLIRGSEIQWAILRLTYIVSINKLNLDPLMFHMPLETCIEICHTKDVGLALVNAVENGKIWGKTLNIAGGPQCRIIYRDYIGKMLSLFGLGSELLPAEAFSKEDFHCGFMDTKESQELLQYQRHTLEDYFEEVKKKVEISRFFNRLFIFLTRPIAKKILLTKSPFYSAES